METSLKAFFASPNFAVAGASSNPAKFGHKVFRWYLQHSLPVVPLNPREPSLTVEEGGKSNSYDTVTSPAKIPDPTSTSLSVITPPPVTLNILKEAKEVGIRAVWLQPGTFDDAVLEFANTNWPDAVLAGPGGNGSSGQCILVDGEDGLALANRSWEPAWPARL